MLKSVIISWAAISASATFAASLPRYGLPPAWVRPIAPSLAAAPTSGSALQELLVDEQAKYGPDGDQVYVENVARIVSPDGLKALASISQFWNPDTDTLTFHRINILRAGKIIDLLAGGKAVTVLRRESGLESGTLDGMLTATVQPEGLQVGDVIDIAASVEHRDPVLQGRSQGFLAMVFPGQVARFHFRAQWADNKPIRWRGTIGMPTPTVSHAFGQTFLLIDLAKIPAPKAPDNAPPRYGNVGQLELSQFANWSEVSALIAPLDSKAEALSASSPLRQRIEAIRNQTPDPKSRAEAALRLVQDEVHYVFLGMNFGGYVPATADLTWSRRFGDCKGKTVLLLALLHGLGIEAEPALVSTFAGDGLDQSLPSLEFFDHVFVRATIGGSVYWLDGTRTGDRGLDDIPLPPVHWVLPIRQGPTELVRIEPRPFAEPAYEFLERVDASGGYESPAPVHLEEIYRGDAAIAWRVTLDQLGRTDALRSIRERFRGEKTWVEAKTVDFAYDDGRHVMRLTLDGTATVPWTKNGVYLDLDIPESNLGFDAAFKREPGPNSDAPFAVPFPDFSRWTVALTLPTKIDGFTLVGATNDVDRSVAARRFVRHVRMENGQVTVVTEESSLAPEFPFVEASAASAALRDLRAYDLSVRGPGTPAQTDEDQTPTREPTNAAEFNVRGAIYLQAHKYERAIADFTAAAKLEPLASKHVYDRGAAYYEMGKDDLAMQDFDRALRLNPSDILALLARAGLHLDQNKPDLAAKDFEDALKVSTDKSMVLQRQSDAYERAGLFERNVRILDALVTLSPGGPERASALNARCYARAEWGHELPEALADCSAALALKPEDAATLDSRGLVRLRLGKFDDAISDYDAALRLSPTTATSLFGRGLAELARGDTKAGSVDLAAARSAEHDIDAEFGHFGLKVPATIQH